MKELPICLVCAQTGFLCINCSDKLENEEITEFDVELAKEFVRMEEDYPQLRDATFKRAIDFGSIVLLIIGPGDRKNFSGKVIEEIQEIFEIDKIQLIEFSKQVPRIVENLVAPAKLLGINQIYLPTGSIEYKARVPEEDKEILPLHAKDLEDIIEELTGKITRIVFE